MVRWFRSTFATFLSSQLDGCVTDCGRPAGAGALLYRGRGRCEDDAVAEDGQYAAQWVRITTFTGKTLFTKYFGYKFEYVNENSGVVVQVNLNVSVILLACRRPASVYVFLQNLMYFKTVFHIFNFSFLSFFTIGRATLWSTCIFEKNLDAEDPVLPL